jgi:(p)ppGpp synthase/HD superfamily hydrolase
MNKSIVSLSKALEFAARKHTGQKRKGELAEPYINHVTEVASLLAEVTNGRDPVLVIGGLLHDTIEDTETTFEELKAEFGLPVARLVREVTDDKSLPKEERKRLQVSHARSISRRAKLLKIADKTSNLKSLVGSPPKGWSAERMREYVSWATRVVKNCRGNNPKLDHAFDEAKSAARASMRLKAKVCK